VLFIRVMLVPLRRAIEDNLLTHLLTYNCPNLPFFVTSHLWKNPNFNL